MNERVSASAASLAEHRLVRRRLPLLALGDEDEAYRLQAAANEILVRSGLGPLAGHKVGATNAVVQTYLGVDHPVAGRVFENTVHTSPAELPHANYVRVGVECEIVMRLGSDLSAAGAPYQREQVVAAIDACMAGMEIIDDRYQDLKRVDACTLIADNALDAGAILGTPIRDWNNLNLPLLTAAIAVNGTTAATGRGADVLGDPLNVIVWLANHLARRGEGLKAGEFVCTGSMTKIVWPAPGDRVLARIDALGSVEAIFG
jgi:2-keto-4-pentenoate hydratase